MRLVRAADPGIDFHQPRVDSGGSCGVTFLFCGHRFDDERVSSTLLRIGSGIRVARQLDRYCACRARAFGAASKFAGPNFFSRACWRSTSFGSVGAGLPWS